MGISEHELEGLGLLGACGGFRVSGFFGVWASGSSGFSGGFWEPASLGYTPPPHTPRLATQILRELVEAWGRGHDGLRESI